MADPFPFGICSECRQFVSTCRCEKPGKVVAARVVRRRDFHNVTDQATAHKLGQADLARRRGVPPIAPAMLESIFGDELTRRGIHDARQVWRAARLVRVMRWVAWAGFAIAGAFLLAVAAGVVR